MSYIEDRHNRKIYYIISWVIVGLCVSFLIAELIWIFTNTTVETCTVSGVVINKDKYVYYTQEPVHVNGKVSYYRQKRNVDYQTMIKVIEDDCTYTEHSEKAYKNLEINQKIELYKHMYYFKKEYKYSTYDVKWEE